MSVNIDYYKLQDALEHIKVVCEKHEAEGCVGCPLGSKYGTCQLATHPKTWQTRHPDTDAFRVLE